MKGIITTLPNFFSAGIKILFYLMIGNHNKKTVYKMRLLGLLNSYLLKDSYYRPYNLNK